MKKHILNKLLLAALPFCLLFLSCREDKKEVHPSDTPTSGVIEVSVDESFRPVMEEQIAMYEASFPGTKIIAHYKSEVDCFKDLFRDSLNRMVIVTRGLTPKEEKFMTDSLGYNPGWNEIASDAIAIVVNKNSDDTTFSLERLQEQLTGKVHREETMVFDGLNRTSTVRFVEDSILKGKTFDTSVVRAVKTSDEVLDYVAANANAVGFVGINRIGNPEDPKQVEMLKKVKLAYIRCDACVNTPYVLPSQESILNHRYPLVRGLYYIIKENYTGLGSGLVAFLKYERGQLIFRRAYLGPIMEFTVRDVRLNEALPKN